MRKLFLFFSLSWLASSCTLFDYSYVVTPQNTADLRKKGELQVDACLPFSRFNFQGAYAPLAHWGIMADYCYGFRGNVHSLDAGTGYFTAGEKNVFNIYGGAGIGNVTMNTHLDGYYQSNTLENNTQYNKLFVQAHVGRQFNRKIKIGLTARLSYVLFNSYAYKNYHFIYKGRASIDSLQLSGPATTWMLQSALTADFYSEKRLSFRMQLGVIGALYADDALRNYTIDASNYPTKSYSTGTDIVQRRHPVYFPVFINAGIRFRINSGRKGKE